MSQVKHIPDTLSALREPRMLEESFYFTHSSTVNNGTVEIIRVPQVIGWFRVDIINVHVWAGFSYQPNSVDGEYISLCSSVLRKEIEPLPKTAVGYFGTNTVQKNVYDFFTAPYMGRSCGKHILGVSHINGQVDLMLKKWDNTNPSVETWAVEMLFTRVQPNTQLLALPKELTPPPVLSCQLIITGQTTRIPLGISGRFRMKICRTSFVQDTSAGAITAITSPSILLYNPTNISSADNQYFNKGSVIINTFPMSSVFCEPIEVLCDINQELQIIAYDVGNNSTFTVATNRYIALLVSFYPAV